MLPALVTLSRAPVVAANSGAVIRAIGTVAGRSFGTLREAWAWVGRQDMAKVATVVTAVMAVPQIASFFMKDGGGLFTKLRETFDDSDVDKLIGKLPDWAAAERETLVVAERDADAKALDPGQVARMTAYENVATRIAKRFRIMDAESLVAFRQDIGMMLEIPGPSWAMVADKVRY